jgi:peptidoglycan/xylan/chitin deacetylase (PgdA/CDA1 family)
VGVVLRLVGSSLSRAKRGGKLSVLIYHRALAEPDPLLPGEPDARVFGWQMDAVARHFRVLQLGEAIERLAAGTLPPRSAAITFDDGYADNYTVAMPILRKLGLPATFFVTTGYTDGGRMWNDSVIEAVRVAPTGTLDLRALHLGELPIGDVASRRRAIDAVIGAWKYQPPAQRDELAARLAALVGQPVREGLMMTSEQIAALAAADGMEIGAHTVTHSLLVKLGDAEARRELADSRSKLRDVTGRDVRMFAYPNGRPGTDYTQRDVRLARELGFAGAVTTAWGAGLPGTDPFQVPRFTPWDRTPTRFVLRLLHNYTRTEVQRT